MSELTYNSVREDLVIPEYGRAIQQMVAHALSIADREERTKCAQAIVSVMGSVAPPEAAEGEDRDKKLWSQLLVMANHQLDVEFPFELPDPANRNVAPSRLNYPSETSRLGHYGGLIRQMIEKTKAYEPGDERDALVLTVANTMKRHFLTWNRGTVENSFIAAQLKELSGGVLELPEGAELVSSAEVLKNKRKTSDAIDRHRGKKRR
jgi:hypothetical protein